MSANRSTKNRFVPSLESLESRELMSVTSVTLDTVGKLRVICDSADNNVSIVRQSSVLLQDVQMASTTLQSRAVSGGSITNLLDSIVVKDLTRTTNNTWTFRGSAVKNIEVDAGAGDDTIISNVGVRTVVFAGGGNNHVETGAAADVMYAGNGNNTILTNGGDDSVFVGNGNNFINGGDGNDHLVAGSGNNVIFGGAGNDFISDRFDANHPSNGSLLYGDAGNDTIVSRNRNDVVDGGADYDTANVKAGTWIVRNCENVSIDVPLGQAAANTNIASAVNAGYRFLRAYGYNPTAGVVLHDSVSGLAPDDLAALLKKTKPDVTLEPAADVDPISHIQHVINLVNQANPVLLALSNRWVVVNGYDSATQTFKYVDNGVQLSIDAASFDFRWAHSNLKCNTSAD